MESFRILFVGEIEPFETTFARRDAFLELGFPLEVVDRNQFLKNLPATLRRLGFYSLRTPPVFAFNRELLHRARRFRPELIWIEKGVYVFPETLRALRRDPSPLLVHHNTDDSRGLSPALRIHWRYLRRAMRLYDLQITSNLHNVRELREAGFPRVCHMELAASPAMTPPAALTAEKRESLGAPVGFIGHWEPTTEHLLLHLVRSGVGLKIFGRGWEKARAKSELAAACQLRPVWGPEYARTALSFDINLGIVSKRNRSHTATRTFQIPALGAFMLHERNDVVTALFEEGVEAEFFGSEDELLAKCRHYLGNPQERQRIAEAGRRRCERSGYSEIDRVREIVPVLAEALRARRRGSPPETRHPAGDDRR